MLRACLTFLISRSLERGLPSLRMKKGPLLLRPHFQIVQNCRDWAQGSPCLAQKQLNPFTEGVCLGFPEQHPQHGRGRVQSTDTSAMQITGAEPFVAVNSPALKKPKYSRQQAAQSRRAVNGSSREPADHILPRLRRMSDVIGRRKRRGDPA